MGLMDISNTYSFDFSVAFKVILSSNGALVSKQHVLKSNMTVSWQSKTIGNFGLGDSKTYMT